MLTYDGERQSYEGPEIVTLRRQIVVAKKSHTCAWCKRPIPVGWNGDWG